jgi:hypothetical protein
MGVKLQISGRADREMKIMRTVILVRLIRKVYAVLAEQVLLPTFLSRVEMRGTIEMRGNASR